MEDGAREALLRLNAASALPTWAAAALWRRLGPDVERASPACLAQAAGIDWETAESAAAQIRAFNAARELEEVRRLKARLIALGDKDYPALLSNICDPPLLLYAMGAGNLEEPAALAFVGTRRPTPYGQRQARSLARSAAQSGAVVVSGLARGIDSEAHEAALACGGKTWAVLGSGLGDIYPPEHAGLARRIAESGGLVLSEFPLAAAPLPGRFPRRNRIISGLSWATVVVEGALRSGSLITARLAAEQGRPVFAVPGPVESSQSAAPNLLIRQGAGLISAMADVWPELPPAVQGQLSLYVGDRAHAGEKRILPEHKKLLECLGGQSRTFDQLCVDLGIDFSRLSNIIFEMELRDLLVALPGQRYAQKGI